MIIDDLKYCGGFVYLATPYSKYPGGLNEAHRDAAVLTGRLIMRGIPVYSPIAHTHAVAMESGIDPFDDAIWIPADEPMMRAAAILVVAKMHGFQQSYGISEEIKRFRIMSKPVFYLDPETLALTEEARAGW